MSVGNFHMLMSNVSASVRYQLLSSTASVSEGESFTLTLNAAPTGRVEGNLVGYTIDGINSDDIDVGLTGDFTMSNDTSQLVVNTAANDDTLLFFYGESSTLGESGIHKYRIDRDLQNPIFESYYPGPGSGLLGMFFKPDGSKLWLQNASADEFEAYTLTGAPSVDQWDLNTIEEDFPASGSYGTVGGNHQGMWISGSGTVLFQVDRDIQYIFQDDIPAWNPLNPGNPGRTLNISGDTSLPTGIFVKPDGTKAFVSSIGTPRGILEYSGTAFQCNNWTLTHTLDVGSDSPSKFPTDVFVDPLGNKMYVSDDNGKIHFYKLDTPWELSTATFLRTLDLSASFDRINALSVVTPPSETFRITLDETDSEDKRTGNLSTTVTINDSPMAEELYYLANTTASIETRLEIPQGVTSISAVVIGGGGGGGSGVNKGFTTNPTNGGGGGGGGALAYGTFAVTPGETLYLGIGRGGERGDSTSKSGGRGDAGRSGGRSYIRRGSFSGTSLLEARGGHGGSSYLSITSRYTATPSGTELEGGGNGGLGGIHTDSEGFNSNAGGGGGAGGYSGAGGQGESADGSTPDTNGSGGGGAGGDRDDFPGGTYGGSVGIIKSGVSGIAPSGNGSTVGFPIAVGGGGPGGGGWKSGYLPPRNHGFRGGYGRPGAIRIIWGDPNTTREYPSTNTEDFLV